MSPRLISFLHNEEGYPDYCFHILQFIHAINFFLNGFLPSAQHDKGDELEKQVFCKILHVSAKL